MDRKGNFQNTSINHSRSNRLSHSEMSAALCVYQLKNIYILSYSSKLYSIRESMGMSNCSWAVIFPAGCPLTELLLALDTVLLTFRLCVCTSFIPGIMISWYSSYIIWQYRRLCIYRGRIPCEQLPIPWWCYSYRMGWWGYTQWQYRYLYHQE